MEQRLSGFILELQQFLLINKKKEQLKGRPTDLA